MSPKKFPITQVTISNKIGRPINSIIQISNLKDFYIQPKFFLQIFTQFFDELPWEKKDLGENSMRKIATIEFGVSLKGLRFSMTREDESDFPIDYFFTKKIHSKPIHSLFGSVFCQFYKFIKTELPRDFVKVEIQFIREKISNGMKKELESVNSNFEGSTVLLNQENILGGESQILEKKKDASTEVIFQQKLEAGDFIFLKNKIENEQNIFHQLTPIKLADESKKSGWMDFMQFEIKSSGLL